MPDQIQLSARGIDLSSRFAISTAITGSPVAAAQTQVAIVTLPSGLTVVSGVLVMGWVAYTIGTNGVSCQVRIRQTGLAGTVIADSGAMTGGHATAGQLVSDDVNGFDTSPTVGGTYVLTLTVSSASATSTVSGVLLVALAI